ncbi:hypothetical protein HYZ98_04735 [Candidatus Peregrinibacteria bacterium]|nr:hypothetical protein [Candidatus Peregrinibacteria bacterium]
MIKPRTATEHIDNQERPRLDPEPHMSADLERCHTLCQNSLISERTRAEYHSMFADLHARRAGVMLRENIAYLNGVITEARSYTEQFQAKIAEALTNHWINAESAARWQQRFHDPSLLECIRKHWFYEHFSGLFENWKNAAQRREQILKNPQTNELKSADVPRIETFRNLSLFLALHWRERAALIAEVEAALRAKELYQQHFFNECAVTLRGWASGPNRFLHPSKVGLWLERIFAGTFSEAERRSFLQGKLSAYSKNWERLRCQFDTIEMVFRKKGLPQGFFAPSLDEFLEWHVNQRETYIAEAKMRLRSPQEEEPTELRYLKQDIRHDLDSRDWEGAEALLKKARLEFPEDLDLKSMERFLQAHRRSNANKDGPQNDNPEQALKEMQAQVAQIDDSVQGLYAKALEEGSDVFRGLTILMFNRVWLHRTGRFLNTTLEAEEQNSEEYKEQTREHMHRGHTDDIERNILSGDTAKEAAINDNCSNAQILYMEGGGEDAVLSRIREQRSNQSDGARGFLFQTSLIPTDLSYGKHEQIVDHLHPSLTQNLRILERHGKTYE